MTEILSYILGVLTVFLYANYRALTDNHRGHGHKEIVFSAPEEMTAVIEGLAEGKSPDQIIKDMTPEQRERFTKWQKERSK